MLAIGVLLDNTFQSDHETEARPIKVDTLKKSLEQKTDIQKLEKALDQNNMSDLKNCLILIDLIKNYSPNSLSEEIRSGKFSYDTFEDCFQATAAKKIINYDLRSCIAISSNSSEIKIEKCAQQVFTLRSIIIANQTKSNNTKLQNMTAEELVANFVLNFLDDALTTAEFQKLESISKELMERYPDSLATRKAKLMVYLLKLSQGEMTNAAEKIQFLSLATETNKIYPTDLEITDAYLLAIKINVTSDEYSNIINTFLVENPDNILGYVAKSEIEFSLDHIDTAIQILEDYAPNADIAAQSKVAEIIHKLKANDPNAYAHLIWFDTNTFYD